MVRSQGSLADSRVFSMFVRLHQEVDMAIERTPPFTEEGTREILHELEHGSPNTPERRRTFERMRSAEFLVERELARAKEKPQS